MVATLKSVQLVVWPVVSNPSTNRIPISDKIRSSLMPDSRPTRHSCAPMSVSASVGGASSYRLFILSSKNCRRKIPESIGQHQVALMYPAKLTPCVLVNSAIDEDSKFGIRTFSSLQLTFGHPDKLSMNNDVKSQQLNDVRHQRPTDPTNRYSPVMPAVHLIGTDVDDVPASPFGSSDS